MCGGPAWKGDGAWALRPESRPRLIGAEVSDGRPDLSRILRGPKMQPLSTKLSGHAFEPW